MTEIQTLIDPPKSLCSLPSTVGPWLWPLPRNPSGPRVSTGHLTKIQDSLHPPAIAPPPQPAKVILFQVGQQALMFIGYCWESSPVSFWDSELSSSVHPTWENCKGWVAYGQGLFPRWVVCLGLSDITYCEVCLGCPRMNFFIIYIPMPISYSFVQKKFLHPYLVISVSLPHPWGVCQNPVWFVSFPKPLQNMRAQVI